MARQTKHNIDWSNTKDVLSHIESLGKGYEFIKFMNSLTSEARNGNSAALSVLTDMLDHCRRQTDWMQKNYWCSMAIRALANTRTPESLKIIIGFIRKLPDTTPFGAIDLISSLLPLYRKIILGPAKELAGEKKQALRAIGIQTLCNLYLEGSLVGEQANYLQDIVKNFQPDRYLTYHHVELVRTATRSRRMEMMSFDEEEEPEIEDRNTSEQDIEDELLNEILSELET